MRVTEIRVGVKSGASIALMKRDLLARPVKLFISTNVSKALGENRRYVIVVAKYTASHAETQNLVRKV